MPTRAAARTSSPAAATAYASAAAPPPGRTAGSRRSVRGGVRFTSSHARPPGLRQAADERRRQHFVTGRGPLPGAVPTYRRHMARSSLPGRLPRGPFSPDFWRSPLRGTWFTSVLGVVLLAGITILFVTGLVSYAAYNPDLSPVNDRTPGKGILGFYLFSWPTDPPWLYRLTQGVHVTLGLGLVPVLLAKLWSVVPKLFTLPPGPLGHPRPGADLAAPAGRRRAVPVRHRHPQHPAGLRLPGLVLPAALLRRVGLLRGVPRARGAQGAGRLPEPARDAARGGRGAGPGTGRGAARPADRVPARGARPGRRGLPAARRHLRRAQLRRTAAPHRRPSPRTAGPNRAAGRAPSRSTRRPSTPGSAPTTRPRRPGG